MSKFIRLGLQQIINTDAIDYIEEFSNSFYIYCFGKLIIVQRSDENKKIIYSLGLIKEGITLINIENIKSAEDFNDMLYLYFSKTAIKLPKTADNKLLNTILNHNKEN
jgi:hypothetical protein